MTTKFENSIINPLTRAPHNNFAVNNTLIIHKKPEGSLLRVKPPSMDWILKSQKIESMKKMMLMQEQLFKQQVEELHRLYNLQKKLMQEIENELKQRKETAAVADITNFDQFTIRHQTSAESKQSFQEFSARNNPNEEISRSNSAENAPTPIKFDLEMAADESTPSSSTHPFHEEQQQQQQHELKKMDEEGDVEVELTLSIGHCTRKQRSKSTEMIRSSRDQLQDSEVQQLASSSSTSVYQEKMRPHWLMQDLSLNRT